MKQKEICSITKLPATWCDVLNEKMKFVLSIWTKTRIEEDDELNCQVCNTEKISEHVYQHHCKTCKKREYDIIIDEKQITEKNIPKYIEELNKTTNKNYVYNKNLWKKQK